MEFADAAKLSLPRDERRELVAYFRERGMSTRAIASATGVARNTVKDDLRQVGQFDPPDHESPVTGLDGKTYTKPRLSEIITGAQLADLNEAAHSLNALALIEEGVLTESQFAELGTEKARALGAADHAGPSGPARPISHPSG